eukprot:c29094_g1_i1 orf=255-416(+)
MRLFLHQFCACGIRRILKGPPWIIQNCRKTCEFLTEAALLPKQRQLSKIKPAH